jgi:Tfp pilus assembly protein PilV
VVFYKRHRREGRFAARGFTLVEAVVSVALIGVGVASTLGALTKFNSIAAMSRNWTGASAVLQNQVDLFQSMSPFNPKRGEVPLASDGTYDMTVGTHTIAYKDPATGVLSTQTDPWPVYREPARWTYADAAARTGATGLVASDVGQLAFQSDNRTFWRLQTAAPTWTQDTTGGMIVTGTMTCTVTDISDLTTTPKMYRYRAVFTLTYKYLSHDGVSHKGVTLPPYSLSMTAVRSSDI